MGYRPDYCNSCGEKVERNDWKLWTSEHFCPHCEGAFKLVDWKSKIYLLIAFIAILFGFGTYLKTPEKTLSLASNQTTNFNANKSSVPKNSQNSSAVNNFNAVAIKSAPVNVNSQNPIPTEAVPKHRETGTMNNPQIVESEPVYFCGAETKKGTPCTRKVKGGGRCWQHTGLPAILPKEKLVFSR